mgnify:CR=1 FL=1
MAKRVRRLLRGGRVVDLGGGHGLLAHAMLLLDDSSPSAIVVDTTLPPSSAKLHAVLAGEWPRLAGRVEFIARGLDEIDIRSTDVVVSSHACGDLTDRVLERASAAAARVAVLPCCHNLATCDAGALSGWVDKPMAIDIMRALRLQQRGYRTWTQTIPEEITPKNRLLIGARRPWKGRPTQALHPIVGPGPSVVGRPFQGRQTNARYCCVRVPGVGFRYRSNHSRMRRLTSSASAREWRDRLWSPFA